jgi:hypothetical protein
MRTSHRRTKQRHIEDASAIRPLSAEFKSGPDSGSLTIFMRRAYNGRHMLTNMHLGLLLSLALCGAYAVGVEVQA